jgi:hypothetical protein
MIKKVAWITSSGNDHPRAQTTLPAAPSTARGTTDHFTACVLSPSNDQGRQRNRPRPRPNRCEVGPSASWSQFPPPPSPAGSHPDPREPPTCRRFRKIPPRSENVATRSTRTPTGPGVWEAPGPRVDVANAYPSRYPASTHATTRALKPLHFPPTSAAYRKGVAVRLIVVARVIVGPRVLLLARGS